MAIENEILEYYDQGKEHGRLTTGPSLELIRTLELLRRLLPAAPARILDVGGGSGVYASRLTEQGYDVDLIDPVPLHVEQARSLGIQAQVGDARRLEAADDAYDAVLLLGPLYHLPERADRLVALVEATRVVRPGGPVVAAAISRYASFFEGFFRNYVDRPGFTELMRTDVRSGRHLNPSNHPERFTTAYFHTPDELAAELAEAGLIGSAVLPVEGMLAWAPGIDDRLADPQQRELILELLAETEADPALLAASSHLLGVGRAPKSG